MLFQVIKTKHLVLITGCLCFIFGLTACQKDKSTVQDPYQFIVPSNFPAPTYTFYNNPVTEKGIKLGKKIFFDPILSIDGTISCGSCHNQALAFADIPLHTVSVGIDGLIGTRNAPALANLAFMKEFFWDGGVTHLDFVPINAIESPVEMGEDISAVIAKFKNHPEYPALFQEAFNTTELNTALVMDALAQFMVMMISNQSKYDNYLKGETILSPEELEGLNLFEQKCENCHSGILFTNQAYHNNGIDTVFADSGRALISANPIDIGKFRVPSLRNVAITGPYMHNARFSTLEEVLDHYATGIRSSNSLDPTFTQGNGDLGIPLTEDEKKAIIAFLKTLTDYKFVNNPIFFKD